MATSWFDDPHHDADRLLLLIDSFDEDLADLVGAGNGTWSEPFCSFFAPRR